MLMLSDPISRTDHTRPNFPNLSADTHTNLIADTHSNLSTDTHSDLCADADDRADGDAVAPPEFGSDLEPDGSANS